MAFTLPQLPYPHNALEPHIDTQTMQIHYGNTMPENSCFLAFYGNHGLIGKHLKMETLKNSSIHEIRELIATHNSG